MPVLDNGDVIPSFLQAFTRPRAWNGGFLDEVKLLLGEVKDIIYPNDRRSRSKRSIEYVVFAQRKSNYTDFMQEFRCVSSSGFGGIADRLTYTFRPDTKNKNKEKFGNGSKVLFFCINGEKHRGVILGGVRDPGEEVDKDAEEKLKHHLSFDFNGISAKVDKDGQLEIKFNGKTDIDGKSEGDSNSVGTTATFSKNGNLKLADKDAKNAIEIDHANGKVKIARDQAFELGAATDKMLLGSSFRDAQKQLNTKLKTFLQQAAVQLNTAGGAVAGPFMAATAGPSIIAAAQLILQAANAIDAFEQAAAQKTDFLSTKNSTD